MTDVTLVPVEDNEVRLIPVDENDPNVRLFSNDRAKSGGMQQVMGIASASDRAARAEADYLTDPATLRKVVVPVPALAVSQVVQGVGGKVRQAGDVVGSDNLAAWGKDFAQMGSDVEKQIQQEEPLTPGSWANSIRSGAVSTYQQLPTMVAAGPLVKAGMRLTGLAASLLPMGAVTGGQSYQKYRDRGFDVGTASAGSAVDELIEVGTELLPMDTALHFATSKAKFGLKQLAAAALKYNGGEYFGETLAMLGQDVTDKYLTNPDLTPEQRQQKIDDYFTRVNPETGNVEAWDNFKETLRTTTAQNVIMMGLGGAANRASREGQQQIAPHGVNLTPVEDNNTVTEGPPLTTAVTPEQQQVVPADTAPVSHESFDDTSDMPVPSGPLSKAAAQTQAATTTPPAVAADNISSGYPANNTLDAVEGPVTTESVPLVVEDSGTAPTSRKPTEVDQAEFPAAREWAARQMDAGNKDLWINNYETQKDYAWRVLDTFRYVNKTRMLNDSSTGVEQGAPDGITYTVPALQNKTEVDGVGISVPAVQGEVPGHGSDISQSGALNTDSQNIDDIKPATGGVQNGVSGMQQEAEQAQEMPPVRGEDLKGVMTREQYHDWAKDNHALPVVRKVLGSRAMEDKFGQEHLDRAYNAYLQSFQSSDIDTQAHEAATSPTNDVAEPTQAQIEAGNYKKGHITLHGLDISIENPAGSVRKGVDETGRQWSTELKHHYGYIKGTVGNDKEHVDVFVKPGANQATAGDRVFVVDQANTKTGAFDEHKVMVGYPSPLAARHAYLSNYDESGPERIIKITASPVEVFKQWLKDGDNSKPFSRDTLASTADSTTAPVTKPESMTAAAQADTPASPRDKTRFQQAHEKFKAKQADLSQGKTYAKRLNHAFALLKAKHEAYKTKVAAHQTRKRVAEATLFTSSVNHPDIGKIASLLKGKNDAEAFVGQTEHYITEQIQGMIDNAETPQEMLAYSEMLVDGKPVLPKEFYESLRKDAAKTFEQAGKDKNRDPEVYRVALENGSMAAGILQDGSDDARQFKEGFDHALKGKTKSTLPGEGQYIAGYKASQQWVSTDAGQAWFEGKKQAKEKSTGESLRRAWDKQKKDMESIDASDMKKAWGRLLKATARADHFPILLAEDATPGAQAWLAKFRSALAAFGDFFTMEAVDSTQSTRRRSSMNAESAFDGSWTSYKGKFAAAGGLVTSGTTTRAKHIDDATRLEVTKQIAEEYQAKLQSLAKRFEGVKDLHEIERIVTELFPQGKNNPLSYNDEYKDNSSLYPSGSDITRILPDDYKYSYWAELKSSETSERNTTRRDSLVRPRLDKIVRKGLPDTRAGKDISAADFKKKFGFGDITIGEYVTAQQAQDHLNYNYDALTTLADLLKAKPSDLSFGGKLHYAIGALGSGKYAAHFQQSQAHPSGGTVPVINVTNTRGDGAVLHEYFHAIDFLTADPRLKSVIKSIKALLKDVPYSAGQVLHDVERFLTGGSSFTRMPRNSTPKDHALYLLNTYYSRSGKSGRRTEFFNDALKLDAGRGNDPYWSNDAEPFARMAEAWAYDALKNSERRDDYLVAAWAEDGKVTAPQYKGTPYPKGEERGRLVKLFNELADAISWDKTGPALKEGHKWQTVLPYEETAAPFQQARKDALANFDEIAEKLNLKKQEELAEKERTKEEAIWGAPPVVEAVPDIIPSEAVVSEDTAVGVSVDELEAIFDEVADSLEAAAQEPGVDAPGVKEFKSHVDTTEKAKSNTLAKTKQTLTAAQEKTATALAKEFAKQGITGIDEALKGLTAIFGGGRIQSFPAGINEEFYKQAKPHFEASAKAFQSAGMSFKEFVASFFKTIIQTFGRGVKPYAVQFAKEYEATYNQSQEKSPVVAAKEVVEADNAPGVKLAGWVQQQLNNSEPISWQNLFKKADEYYGGTQAEGVYSVKDAYDAVELGINQALIDDPHYKVMSGMMNISAEKAALTSDQLQLEYLDKIPTQTKRTAEMDEFQQFSTPPHFAWLANWAANLNKEDIYLEPSAGIGGMATFAKMAGVKEIIVNELSARRLALLRQLPFDRFFSENAEQLDNILPDDVKPTVIVMNPPFSSTAGRVQGQRDTMNGGKHIEQALARLAPGGRLVAIVGEGMAHNKPAFRDWWKKIEQKYAVRANIGIDAASWAKYGTTFDNQILVIDKVAPTGTKIVTGKVKHPNDAFALLEGVRNERPIAEAAGTSGAVAVQSGSGTAVQSGTSNQTAVDATGGTGPAVVGSGGSSTQVQPGIGSGTSDSGRVAGNDESAGSNADPVKSGRAGTVGHTGGTSDATDKTTDSTVTDSLSERLGSEVALKALENLELGEINNNQFEQYTPQKVRMDGAVPHNTPLVESAALAAVTPPDPTYTPNLPKEVIKKGLLSDAQLEAVVYAGQAHQQWLVNGERRGFFLGDGTGVGKGRQISGIIMDNMRQGQKKAVWISKKTPLIEDAKRDFADIGGDEKLIFKLDKTKSEESIKAEGGILFAGYSLLRGQSKIARDANKKAGNKTKSTAGISYVRTQQIYDWLGKDFDGVIVFDEAHEMGNAVPTKGSRGAKKPSEQALAALELQRALPKAKIVYVSATGATEVANLAYAERLGLWGEGTPFNDVHSFIGNMSKSVSAMELVAQNLKQMGLYLARSLSFDGIQYSKVEHELTGYQRETYDLLAGAWQTVLQNIHAALEDTGVTNDGKGSGKEAGKIKMAIMSAFWGTHQRFFNQIITAGAMPSVLDQIEKDLAEGKSVVMQLVNTNEADQERALAKLAGREVVEGEEDNVEEMDLTPREQLIQFIERAFPVTQMEAYADGVNESGKPIMRLRVVVDSQGKPVINKTAAAKRDALIENIRGIKIPDAALQMLFNHFGPDRVAEITGRTQRVIYDEKGKMKIEKRNPSAVFADSNAFKDGKKRMLVFSQAGGTGFSFHADRRYKNQEQRVHYILQPGWSADKAIQGLGRSHRTNQSSTPIYRLVTTDIPAQKRFISSIARRLEQLGALTSGQRDAAGGSLFSAADNLESVYSKRAVMQFFRNAFGTSTRTGYDTLPADLLEQMGLKGILDEDTNQISEEKIPQVTQFLNRLLSLRLETQGTVFDLFLAELEQQVEAAKQMGVFDDGMQTIRHVGAEVNQEDEVYRDPMTNAATKYLAIEYQTPNSIFDFDTTHSFIEGRKKATGAAGWFINKHSGKIAGIYKTTGTRTNKDGRIENVMGLWRTSGNSYETEGKVGRLDDKWTRIDDVEEARKAWDLENSSRSKTSSHKLNMVVGGVLPIWDRFNNDTIKVVRIGTNDGRRFLGRQIDSKDLAETMKKLNVQSPAAKMTGTELAKEIMAGNVVEMSNGWKFKKVRVSNDVRIETVPKGYPSMSVERMMNDAGVIQERISYANRYFVPTNTEIGAGLQRSKAGAVLDALMRSFGMNAVDIGTVQDEDGPKFSLARNGASGKINKRANKIERGIYVPERLLERYDAALSEGTLGAASTIARRSQEAVRGREITGSDLWERSQQYRALAEAEIKPAEIAALRQWAEKTGKMITANFDSEYSKYSKKGGQEHLVYLSEDGKRFHKANNLSFHETYLDYFHRLAIHNTEFPETAYAFEGFIERDGKLMPVTSQAAVRGRKATFGESHSNMLEKGYMPEGTSNMPTSYSVPGTGLFVRDVHGDNTRVSESGNIYTIDPVIEYDIMTKPDRLAQEVADYVQPENKREQFGDEVDDVVAEWEKSPDFSKNGQKDSIPLSEVVFNTTASRIIGRDIASDITADGFIIKRNGADLPAPILKALEKQGTDPNNVDGVFHRGKVYIVRDNITSADQLEAVLFHEWHGHAGLFAMYNNDGAALWDGMLDLYNTVTPMVLKKVGLKYGINLTHYSRGMAESGQYSADQIRVIFMEEMLAFLTKEYSTGKIAAKINEVIGQFRNWLRKNGYAKLAKWGETDLAFLLKRSRMYAESGAWNAKGDEVQSIDGEAILQKLRESGITDEQLKALLDSSPRFSEQLTSNETDNEDEAKFSIRHDIEKVSTVATLDKLKGILNPLDYSRFKDAVIDHLPNDATMWIADNLGNPYWVQENNPAAQPFYETAKDREVSRMDNNIRMFGGLVDNTGKRTTWEKVKGLGQWNEHTTAWGKMRKELYDGLTDTQKAAYDVIRYEGDAYNKTYETLPNALRNKRIKAAGMDAQTFAFYREALAAEDASFEEKLKIAADNMAEAGMDLEKIKGHIAEYRSRYADLKGWVHRDHGEGDHVVRVYHTIDRLDLAHDLVQHHGEDTDRIRLAYFPGIEISRAMEKITEQLGGTFKQLRDGGIVMLFQKGQGEFAQERFDKLQLQNKKGEHKYKVLVYNRFVGNAAQAKKLSAEIKSNLAAALPRNFYKDHVYDTSWNFSSKLQEADFQELKTSDMKMEQVLSAAIDKAASKEGLNPQAVEGIHQALVQNVAEALLGRGAGLYQIRRSNYLIEGYDQSAAVKKYEDYVNGTAGLFSKAQYALRQFKNMKSVAPKLRNWATKYVADSLRNMGAGDRMSGNIRSLVSLWYLGFNTSWMLVNSTQPLVVGQAELSRYTKSAFLKIAKCEKDVLTGKLTDEEKGILQEHATITQDRDSMMAEMTGSLEGVGGKASQTLHAATTVSMALGQHVEVLNRHTMIIAAYRVFKNEKGLDRAEAYRKALEVNSAVNIDMGRYNLPSWARGPVGRTFYSLQSYIQHMLNYLWHRSSSGERGDQKAVLRLLFAMFLLGGAPAGAPGSDELDKLIQQFFGYSPRLALKGWTRKFAKEYGSVGEMLEGFVWHGIPGAFKPSGIGVSLTNSIQLRMPIVSNIIGGDDMAKSLSGPVGGLVQKGLMATRAAQRGDLMRTAEYLAPTALANPLSAYRQATQGVKTGHGKTVEYKGKALKMEPQEAALRAIGLQPVRTADISETRGKGFDLAREWRGRRQEALDNYRTSRKMKYIIEFNKELRASQANGLSGLSISPESMKNVWNSPDKKKAAWEERYGID